MTSILDDLGLTAADLREAVEDGTLARSRSPLPAPAARPDDLALARERRALAERLVTEAHLRGEPWAAVQGPSLIAMAERAVERALRRRAAAGPPRRPGRRRQHGSTELRAALGLPTPTT